MRSFLIEGTKEAAFTTAITAAALAFQISHSCGKGNSVPCSCEVSKRSAGRVDSSKLNKCRINIPHGTTFASSFLSVTSDSSSPVSDIDRHNIQVGLKASALVIHLLFRTIELLLFLVIYPIIILVPRAFPYPAPPARRGREKALGTRMLNHICVQRRGRLIHSFVFVYIRGCD